MFDNGIKPFRYWTHVILPLVYEDSLSYMELLAKVVAKLNEVIGYLSGNIEDLVSETINQFFANITYTEELEQINFIIERSEE